MQRLALSLVSALMLFSIAGRVSAQQQPQTFAQPARTTASWTSATAVNTRVTIPTTNFSVVNVTFSATTTMLGGYAVFELDDGSGTYTWPIVGSRLDSGIDESGYPLSPRPQAWVFDVVGSQSFSVRLLAPIEGTGTVTWSLTASAAPGVGAVITPSATTGGSSTTVVRVPPMPGALGVLGTFNRRIGSTGDALNVYLRNPIDPCSGIKGSVAISQTANAQLLAGIGNRNIAICSVFIVAADAENISLVEGTGATCGTSTAAVIGATTAASGVSNAAQAGWVEGTGTAMIATTKTVGNSLCLLQSGSGVVAGNLTYVPY